MLTLIQRRKRRTRSRNTNILDQTDNFDFLAAYQAYECYDDDELMDDEDKFDDEECQPD